MTVLAGAATRDISPTKPMQLCGYPHVRRVSTGIHDPLLASALYLKSGDDAVLLCALDILMLNSDVARRIRRSVAERLSIPEACVMISCTHTHSGPVTVKYLPFGDNPAMPAPDPDYLGWIEQGTVEAADEARRRAAPAEIAWTTADGRGVGGNRHSANGPADPEAGVLAVRAGGKLTAAVVIYSMHPTVMHEDSTLVSSDFPYYTRRHLQDAFGDELVVLYHTGPCGNQSPRHFVNGQTFAEAERLGRTLGAAVVARVAAADFVDNAVLGGRIDTVELPRRHLPSVKEAEALLAQYRAAYEKARSSGVGRADVRTLEVAVFGAEGTLTLAQAEERGEIEAMVKSLRPVEVQVLRAGSVCLAGVPGEMFVEYPLDLKSRASMKTFVIECVNGELQGYIVTADAAAAGGYEAAGRVFEHHSGPIMVEAALRLVKGMQG